MFGLGVQTAFPSPEDTFQDVMNSSGSLNLTSNEPHLVIGGQVIHSPGQLLNVTSAQDFQSGNNYPSWAKSSDDRMLYDIYQMQLNDSVSSAQQKLQDELTLMDRAYELNQNSRLESWKADVEGMKAAGINPAAYFARNGGFSAPTVSAGSAAQASVPDLNMSSYLSSKYSSDSSAKAARYAATTQLVGTLLNTTGTLLYLAGKK